MSEFKPGDICRCSRCPERRGIVKLDERHRDKPIYWWLIKNLSNVASSNINCGIEENYLELITDPISLLEI